MSEIQPFYNKYEKLVTFIINKDIDSIKELVQKNPDIVDNHCLYLACRTSNLETIKTVIDSGNNSIDFLHIADAAFHADLESVQYLIDMANKKKIDIITEINASLGAAAKKNNIEMISYLLKLGADISYNRSYAVRTILDSDHLETLEYFLQHTDKTDPQWQNIFGDAFVMAADKQQEDVANLFIKYKLSLQWLKKYGNDYSKTYAKKIKAERLFNRFNKKVTQKNDSAKDNLPIHNKMKL